MNTNEELWEKYYHFFEKSFQEQCKYNKKRLEDHFRKWKNTKTAKHLCEKEPQSIEDVPLTEYSDYPLLENFGNRIEEVIENTKQEEDENLWNYYSRISLEAYPSINEWLPGEFDFPLKTSGTTGEPKWSIHTKEAMENYTELSIASVLIGCSSGKGNTEAEEGDRILFLGAPPPYGGSFFMATWKNLFELVPSPETIEKTNDMREKIKIISKTILEKNIHIAAGVPSLLKFIIEKLEEKSGRKINEISKLKGIFTSGSDPAPYLKFFEKKLNLTPLNLYANSEAGILMIGTPERKEKLIPCLKACYFEFIDEDNEIKKIDELKKDKVYEVVVSPFNEMLMRYRPGDLLRVVDFDSNGMPYFEFEGRKKELINLYGYFRLSKRMASQTIKNAGLNNATNWAVAKESYGEKERLIFMTEEENWNLTEQEASEALFKSLKETSQDFENYVTDFGIKEPEEAIHVEYLSQGAFAKYSAIREKEGVPIGQMKPPRIIPPKNKDIAKTLRSL